MKKLALKEENREKYCNPPLEKRIKGAISNPIVKHLATCTGIGGLAGTGLMFLVPDKNFRKCMPGIGAGIGLALSGPTFQHKMAKWREKAKRTRELNKLKKKGLEKKAVLGTLAVGAAGGQLAHNIGMHTLLKHPELGIGQLLTRALVEPGRNMKTISGDIGLSVAKGLIPEVGILNNNFHKFSKNLHDYLDIYGITKENMSRGDLLAIGHLLRGNFDKAFAHGSYKLKRALQGAISEVNPTAGKLLDQVIDGYEYGKFGYGSLNKEQATAFLKDLQSIVVKNKLTGPFVQYFRNNDAGLAQTALNKVRGIVGKGNQSPVTKPKNGTLHKLVNAQGYDSSVAHNNMVATVNQAIDRGIGAALPHLSVFNRCKSLVMTPVSDKIPKWMGRDYLIKAQKKLTDKFVNDPIKNSFGKGLAGENTGSNMLPNNTENTNFSAPDTVSTIFRPITTGLKDLSSQVGLAARKVGIPQEIFTNA